MTTVLKLTVVLLCGYVFMGAVKQAGNDFADTRYANQARIEQVIDNCR